MNKHFITILTSVFFVLALNAQNSVGLNHSLHPIKKGEIPIYNLEYQVGDSGIYIVKIYYSDDHLLMSGFSLDSLGQQLNGESTWYYKNGQLQAQGSYKCSQKLGVWKRYNEDGSRKPDRHYSNVNMNTIVFNSALVMPKPKVDSLNFEEYIIKNVIAERAFDIVSYSPVAIQLLIGNDGSVRETKYDDRLTMDEMETLAQMIKKIPSWSPGSNGTQNLNVRVNYLVKFPTE